jgi:hypothetical protein
MHTTLSGTLGSRGDFLELTLGFDGLLVFCRSFWGREGYRHMEPLGLGNGAFDIYMIDLPIIVSALSFRIQIGVGTPGNYKDCVMGGEGVGLLWRLLDLRRGWWQGVGFGLDLRIGVV